MILPIMSLWEHLSSGRREMKHLRTNGSPVFSKYHTSTHNFVLPFMPFPSLMGWGGVENVQDLEDELSHPSLCGHKGSQRKRNQREWRQKNVFLVGENDSEVWRQQLLRSACTVALNTPHSQTRLVMRHLAPSLTCRTRKFPQEFTTWRERKQVILHQMNLNTWVRIQDFSTKINK